MTDREEIFTADPADRDNNLVVAGAVLALLCTTQSLAIDRPLTAVERVTDAEGNPTNQIDIGLSFMLSPYRITVERVTDAETEPS